jgi:hypothetical protein
VWQSISIKIFLSLVFKYPAHDQHAFTNMDDGPARKKRKKLSFTSPVCKQIFHQNSLYHSQNIVKCCPFTEPNKRDCMSQNVTIADTESICSICISTLVFSFRFLPESCRYLLVNKRHDEAIKQLETVARWNGKPMPKVELEVPKEIVSEKSDVRDLFYDKNVGMVTISSWMSW